MNIKPGVYRHYKGNRYQVVGVARHSETEQRLVVYRALYGARGLWVRPLEMFSETVEVGGGRRVPRFAFVAEDEDSPAPGGAGEPAVSVSDTRVTRHQAFSGTHDSDP